MNTIVSERWSVAHFNTETILSRLLFNNGFVE